MKLGRLVWHHHKQNITVLRECIILSFPLMVLLGTQKVLQSHQNIVLHKYGVRYFTIFGLKCPPSTQTF